MTSASEATDWPLTWPAWILLGRLSGEELAWVSPTGFSASSTASAGSETTSAILRGSQVVSMYFSVVVSSVFTVPEILSVEIVSVVVSVDGSWVEVAGALVVAAGLVCPERGDSGKEGRSRYMAGRKVASSISWKVDGKNVVEVATTVVEGKVVTSSAGPTVVISGLSIGVVLCAVEVSSSGLPVVPGFTDLLSSQTLGSKELLLVTLVAEVAVTSLVEVSSTALSVVTL